MTDSLPPDEPRRRRLTPFGTIIFILSFVLLLSKLTGWMTGAEDFVTRLADGFRQVNAFQFAVTYEQDFQALVAPSSPADQVGGLMYSPPPAPQPEPGGTSLPAAVFGAFFQAMGQSFAAGGWARFGFLLSLVFGLAIMWDSIKENWFWIAAVPFVGGVVAWVLSAVVIQFALWSLLLVMQLMVIVGSASAYAPHLSSWLADVLDKFHLTKSVASGASRMIGTGDLAEKLENLERRPPV